MTFEESIPIAKKLAENTLNKGFDVEAFLILSEINKMDLVPDSQLDEITDVSKNLLAVYLKSNTNDSLSSYLNQIYQIISELYHNADTEKKIIIKNYVAKILDMM